jgi:ABC-type lipoprotein release transport system permease subunit
MNALAFAWRSLVRQPARTTLGVLGVAAVGALLFDMLLLSHGLIVSMRDLLARRGYDIRVTSTTALPRSGPLIRRASATAQALGALPGVRGTLAIRFADAQVHGADGTAITVTFEGLAGNAEPPWSLVRGRAPADPTEVLVSEAAVRALTLDVGSTVSLLVQCRAAEEALPALPVRVSGIAEFTFELSDEITIAGPLAVLQRACGGSEQDAADVILVVSSGDAARTAAGIRSARPDLEAATNEQMLGRIQDGGFTYFRQISSVLTTVTVSFSALLITVLLTVSVNQRLGEIAALRALGFSRGRMVADVLSESALIVGLGGVLSLPLGWALALGLDGILRRMPGIPAQLHFFAYQTDALLLHVALLAATALLAALYPMRIVARLPIAATLRAEVID